MKPWCLTIYFVVAESLSTTRFGVFFFSAFYYPKEQFSLQSDEEEKHQRHNGSPSFLQWSVNVMSVFFNLEISYYLMIFLKSLEEFQSLKEKSPPTLLSPCLPPPQPLPPPVQSILL